ncbi:MAG: type II toxin-antitoxin system VapC family toxin [Gemmatimonadaceae bacterium]
MAGAARLTILADTGALYALIDRKDAWHARVKAFWARTAEEIVVPAVVLPEITYLLLRRIGAHAELAFTRAVADGDFVLDLPTSEDVERAADLMAIYSDVPIGFVDAALTAAGERLGVLGVLTTDRRHFSIIRPRHAVAFRLLP